MRELKFRAWDKQAEKMEENFNIGIGAKRSNGSIYHIMQYTGLKDKNGKEIYEGDIFSGIYEKSSMFWCHKCCGFQLKLHGIKDYECMACEGDIHLCELVESLKERKTEVIGNIYQNPELLNN